MIPLKRRVKIWQKIAQQADQPASSTSSPSLPTTPPAPAFNAISGPWAWVAETYNPTTTRYLAFVLNMIHVALHHASNGQFNLQKNQNNISSIDPSGMPSVDAKYLAQLAQLFYRTFLNNGQRPAQAPSPAQIGNWADSIIRSQPLINLSQMNPTGPTAQQLRLDGSFRQNMINYLNYIKQYNPAQQQQTR